MGDSMEFSLRHVGIRPETWDVLQQIAERIKNIPPPNFDDDSGDREPRIPGPIAPAAGAIALELAKE